MNNAKKSRPNPTGEQPEGAPGDWLGDPRRSDLSLLPPLPDPAVFSPRRGKRAPDRGVYRLLCHLFICDRLRNVRVESDRKVLLRPLMLVVFVALSASAISAGRWIRSRRSPARRDTGRRLLCTFEVAALRRACRRDRRMIRIEGIRTESGFRRVCAVRSVASRSHQSAEGIFALPKKFFEKGFRRDREAADWDLQKF